MERLNQKEVGVGTSEFVPFSESDCLQINEDRGVQSKKIHDGVAIDITSVCWAARLILAKDIFVERR